MIQRYGVVKCSVCKETKMGGEVKFDEKDPFNINKIIAVCDDCTDMMDLGEDEE